MRVINDKDKEIIAIWDDLEESEPDRSTEYLIARTADAAKVDYSRVVSALRKVSVESPADGK